MSDHEDAEDLIAKEQRLRHLPYIWDDDSNVYHRRDSATEKCNLDDLVGRQEGNEPPEGRELCAHCHEQGVWEAAQK